MNIKKISIILLLSVSGAYGAQVPDAYSVQAAMLDQHARTLRKMSADLATSVVTGKTPDAQTRVRAGRILQLLDTMKKREALQAQIPPVEDPQVLMPNAENFNNQIADKDINEKVVCTPILNQRQVGLAYNMVLDKNDDDEKEWDDCRD